MTEIKLRKTELKVLDFLQKSKNGITVEDCRKLFGTSECRRIISTLRDAGIPITHKWESYKDLEGTVHRYKRYFIDSTV